MTTGECDCCGKQSTTIVRCWYGNLETFACAACRGINPADYDEPPDNPKKYEHEEKLEKALDRWIGIDYVSTF